MSTRQRRFSTALTKIDGKMCRFQMLCQVRSVRQDKESFSVQITHTLNQVFRGFWLSIHKQISLLTSKRMK